MNILQTFKAIKDQTPELCMAAVQFDGEALQYVKEQTLELCVEAVKQTKKAFKYTKFQTKQMCWDALREQYYGNDNLRYVLDQTEDMCLFAVGLPRYECRTYVETTEPLLEEESRYDKYKKCYYHYKYEYRYQLQDVKEQTDEICIASIKAYPESIEFVKNQTPELCMAALDAVKKRNAPTTAGATGSHFL